MRACVIFAVAALLVGCVARVQFTALTTETFPPNSPSQIELFLTKLPDREYIEIGALSLTARGTQARFLEVFKQTAADMGADAIIIQSQGVQVVGGQMVNTGYGNSVFIPHRARVMQAVAIRWKE